MYIDEIFHIALRTAFACLFAAGVVHKTRALPAFTETIRGYLRVFETASGRSIRSLAILVVAAELAVL